MIPGKPPVAGESNPSEGECWTEERARLYCQGMEANVKHDHRRWAKRIAADLRACRPDLEQPVILDVAAGPAFLLLELAPYFPSARLLVNDNAPIMLELAQERAHRRNRVIEKVASPAEALDLPDSSVDVVLCKHYLRLSPDPLRLLETCCRVLKPGGLAYIVDFNAEASKLKAAVLWAWIFFMNSRELALEFRGSLGCALPVGSVPDRCAAAGFASASILARSLSYLVRAARAA